VSLPILAIHFIRAKSSLNSSSVPFPLYYAACWSGEEEENRGKGEEERRQRKSVDLITGRMVFHILFIL